MQPASPKILSTLPDLLKFIPQVEIDKVSNFKYIFISLYIRKKNFNASTDSLVLIRGTKKCSFHADIFNAFKQELKALGFIFQTSPEEPQKDLLKAVKMEVLGGGWLDWLDDGKKLKIFGESQAYGMMDHNKTKEVILKGLNELKTEDIVVEGFY